MTDFHLIQRDGGQREVALVADQSLMEVIRDASGEESFALCGGSLSCATCHVYVDPAIVGELPEMSETEGELLDSSGHREAGSRLSCQVPCSDVLADRRVVIAPLD